MLEFNSWRSFWDFHKSIVNECRYIRSDSTNLFLDVVSYTSEKRIKSIDKGQVLWRAQLGHDWFPRYDNDEFLYDEPTPFSPKRMKPLINEAKEGRANPKGIPFIYLASNKETAIGEVRPWIGSLISVGAFVVSRALSVVDISEESEEALYYFEEPAPEKREQEVWSDIGKAFSRPITNTDSNAEYAPTQVLAELFKQNGLDGLVYKSSLGNGKNIVLFNTNDAELKSCYLYEVQKLNFESSESSNPYYIDD